MAIHSHINEASPRGCQTLTGSGCQSNVAENENTVYYSMYLWLTNFQRGRVCLEGDRQVSSHKSLSITSHLWMLLIKSGFRLTHNSHGGSRGTTLKVMVATEASLTVCDRWTVSFLRGEERSVINVGEKDKTTGPSTVEAQDKCWALRLSGRERPLNDTTRHRGR